jgi:hypothetical protein
VAYGHAIVAPIRRRIRIATREYLDWVEFEQKAAMTAESEERICAIKKAAGMFRQTVLVCPASVGTQANFYAMLLISKHMGLAFKGRHGLQNLALKLDRDVSKGCERALAELRNKKDSGFRRGEMWELWVRKLTAILSKNELPTQVRKDVDKTKAARPSPFVSFIRELQACLPEKYRRSHGLRPYGYADFLRHEKATQLPRNWSALYQQRPALRLCRPAKWRPPEKVRGRVIPLSAPGQANAA